MIYSLFSMLSVFLLDQEVHEHKCTYEQYDSTSKSHTWKCEECGESGVEPCTFSEWTSTDGKIAKRTCKLCGGEDTATTLSDALNDETTKELITDKIDTTESALTIPEGTIVTVEVKSAKNDITVNGTLVLKKNQSNLKLKGTGTVVYAPEVEDDKEFAKQFPNVTKILSGITSNDEEAAKSLKYEIKVPEMEEPQTITEASHIKLRDGWNLTVDLGKNILKTTDTSNSFITNEGDLTLKNGIVEIPADSQKFVIGSSANTTATLNLENVDIIGHSGISTNGHLVMKGGKIESNGTASGSRALQILGDGATNKAITTELNDVDLITKHVGVYIHTDLLHDLVMTGGSITVDDAGGSGDSAIYSSSQYSSITLDDTKIESDGLGIYLANNNGSKPNPIGGNVANLKNVTIKSLLACLTAVSSNDKFVVDGGSYISGSSRAVFIAGETCGLSTFKDCTLSGWDAAIALRDSAKGNEDKYFVLTNVTQETKK